MKIALYANLYMITIYRIYYMFAECKKKKKKTIQNHITQSQKNTLKE